MCLANIYFQTLFLATLQAFSLVQTFRYALPLIQWSEIQISVGEFIMKKIKQRSKIWDLNSSVLLSSWIIAQYLGLPVTLIDSACLFSAKDCGAQISDLSLRNPGLSTECCLEIVELVSQLEQSPAPTHSYRIQFGSYFSCHLFGCHCIVLHYTV